MEKLTNYTTKTGVSWVTPSLISSYKKGITRGASQVAKISPLYTPKPNFVQTALKTQFSLQKIELLNVQALDSIARFNTTVESKLAQKLEQSLLAQKSITAIKKESTLVINSNMNTRLRVLAETSPVDAQSTGQLFAYELLEIKNVSGMAEILTAGDDNVCSECADLENQVYTITEAMGIIPVHARCRCAWRPILT